MTVELEFPEDLAIWVRRRAEQSGLDERAFVISTLEERRRTHEDLIDSQSADETTLLDEIGKGLAEQTYERYRTLVSRSEDGQLSAGEHEELVRLIDLVEWDNVQRLARVAKLAKLRGVTMPQIMQELGLDPSRE